jgi:hypothetical protein
VSMGPLTPQYFSNQQLQDAGSERSFDPLFLSLLAMDHACIRVGDLWKMGVYFPAIEQSFKDIADEGDDEEEVMLMRASLTE